MHTDRVHRRRQFSSCDACRKSRVACDALRRRPATEESSVATCSRCAARNRHCSFEWMKKVVARADGSSPASDRWNPLLSPPPSYGRSQEEGFNLSPHFNDPGGDSPRTGVDDSPVHRDHGTPTPSARSSLVSLEVSNWLRSMYEDVFEQVFGSWLGNYSCPFSFGENGHLEGGASDHPGFSLSVSISSLCRQFDQLMKDLEKQGPTGARTHPPTQAELVKEWQIETTLNQAIQTFSARWLPLTYHLNEQKLAQTPLIQSLWRELRQNLLKSMNRPCYRSMLSLYLFAMVPVPVGIPEDEEESGVPAQVCVQAALQQVQYLRARQRSLEFNGSKVSLLSDQAAPISTPEQIRSEFMHIESMIYWAAMTFDTSSALTFNTKSVLSSGLLGWEAESSWRMVQTCTNIFHEQSERWRTHGVLVTEETANQIIGAAHAWKLRVWKMGTILKEALREGHGEDAVYHAHTSAAEAIRQFNVTYRPLLAACERRLQFLSQHTKLRWYELMVHHHLSILIMIDAIEIASREDILEKMSVTKSDAQGSLLNCLQFGLSNHFTIPTRQGPDSTSGSFPLVAIDPYPHHLLAGVQLLWKGIERDFDDGQMDQTTCENLQSILLQTLELLPQTSKSVRKGTEQAQFAFLRQER
ncbi:uncharacterized protein N7496_006525 [Penicillium cataractarum]|uniref:Zn(2)-C6 fungal-type domain-containing protein n=1 Tax=Penicillium cataractarum TaxID=2100454 RepID=A0A9W9V679_9EURO|nr:uncharacterized protein N7496_006525 [Penicillium cataractarum]KAJ5370433.1 hypothetical protein N7496_006525 [Penicillium cataractarum]